MSPHPRTPFLLIPLLPASPPQGEGEGEGEGEGQGEEEGKRERERDLRLGRVKERRPDAEAEDLRHRLVAVPSMTIIITVYYHY